MNDTELTSWQQDFDGEVVLPGDTEYESLSGAFMHPGKPAVVFQPRSAAAVAQAIGYSAENKLQLSIRSGGHSGPGFGTNTGGVVIDMSLINAVEVLDATQHLVRVGSGATWGKVAQELHPHGLSLSSGDTRSVGVGGLTLGGGIGWMVRTYGLTIDSLIAAELVTANGQVLRVSATENPDLFWAIRGGGGNFGVITFFEFRTYPVTQVFAGPISYGIENLAKTLSGWRDAMRIAPLELNSTLMVLPSFGGNPPGVMILNCYAGDDETKARTALDPLRHLGQVMMDGIKLKTYSEILEEAHPPQGATIVAHNTFINHFSDELVDKLATIYGSGQGGFLQLRSLGGAMNKIQPEETAFAHRQAEALLMAVNFLPPAASPEMINQVEANWQTLAIYGSGAYANLLGTATEADVAAAYPPATYERLARIKHQFDPTNLFSLNFNIKPKV